jgi:hypothetical protein
LPIGTDNLNQISCNSSLKEFHDSQLLESVATKLNSFDWPMQICENGCDCGKSFVPSWVLQFATLDPCLKCLDIQEIGFPADSFSIGLQLAHRHCSEEKPDVLSKVFEFLFSGLTFPSNQSESKRFHSLELDIKTFAGIKSMELYSRSSGFFCGYVVYEQQRRWTEWRQQALGSIFINLSLCSLMELIVDVMEPIQNIRSWLNNMSGQETYPNVTKVLKAALFWNIQWVLYLIYDLQRVGVAGWLRTAEEFQRGLLLWQQGWISMHPNVCKLIRKMMYFD